MSKPVLSDAMRTILTDAVLYAWASAQDQNIPLTMAAIVASAVEHSFPGLGLAERQRIAAELSEAVGA